MSDSERKCKPTNIGSLFNLQYLEGDLWYVLSCIKTSKLELLTNYSNYYSEKMTVEIVKTTSAYLIANADLWFAIVEHPSFHDILKLCNVSTKGM